MPNTSDTDTAFIISIDDEAANKNKWMACLIVLQGVNTGERILLSKDKISIGRLKEMDLCLAQEGVSRQHAVLERLSDEQFLLRDTGSTNGTFVNGKDITTTFLADQDLITIGTVTLKFVSSDSPEQAYYDELYRQTSLDKALQIYNKHYFLSKLDEEIARCRRYDIELSLVLFDVDHFKKLNDVYGHLAGDKALLHLVAIVKQRLRDTDIFCRYGGEEFAIIMPHTTIEHAFIVAEHTRSLIAKAPMLYDNQSIPMTISLGITRYSNDSVQPCISELLIAQADKALYHAKRSGRNKAVIFSSTM